jgi:hypothetical protein
VAVIASNVIDFELDHPRIALLDANAGSSWSHRATAAALAAGALVAGGAALRPRAERLVWATTAGILGVLFVTEISTIHVAVDRHSLGKLVYVPLLAALVACLWRLFHGRSGASAVRTAVVVLAASYVVHLFGARVLAAVGWGPDSLAYQLKVGLKEGSELAGWLLVIIALVRLSRARRPASGGLDLRSGAGRKLARWPIGKNPLRGYGRGHARDNGLVPLRGWDIERAARRSRRRRRA